MGGYHLLLLLLYHSRVELRSPDIQSLALPSQYTNSTMVLVDADGERTQNQISVWKLKRMLVWTACRDGTRAVKNRGDVARRTACWRGGIISHFFIKQREAGG